MLLSGAIGLSRHIEDSMPKRVSNAELDAIVDAVAELPSGASLNEIGSLIEIRLPRRTLQRRLAQLVEQRRLTKQGRGPSTRYQLPIKDMDVHPSTGGLTLAGEPLLVETYIPITEEAVSIKQVIRESIQKRQPVGYNRAFLDDYRPNDSYYLSTELREHLSEMGRPPNNNQPAGTYVRKVLHRVLIDLSWNSSRLEGNTYSLLETERLLELGEAAEGKDALEAQMILNHKAAIEMLVEHADEIGFNRYTVLNLHALLSENLLPDPQACGRLRTIGVGIDGTVFHPLEVPQLIDECFQQVLDTAEAITDPFEQSFFCMVHLPYLQPFEDVNKRVSRLAANLPFIQHNLSPLSFVDVPDRAYVDGILGIYELNRTELLRDVFVWAYDRSCARYSAVRRSLGEPDAFRMHYRTIIGNTVADIVDRQMDKNTAPAFIRQRAEADIPQQDHARFSEVVETEVMSLHEGNIARYKLRPSQFRKWQETWR